MSKIAIKKLSRSDLTLFAWQLKNMPSGNQKAINLNADVFVSLLYPDLPSISAQQGKTSFLVDLSVYGPGNAVKHSLARKIVKNLKYKNWRLNGEFIHNPLDTPERYDLLREGDFGILIFSGEPIFDELKLILVSAHHSEDFLLHEEIKTVMGGASMRAFNLAELGSIVKKAKINASHAANIVDVDNALEDASQGGLFGIEALKSWTPNRKVSKDELKKSRARADMVGMLGEEFVADYLENNLAAGKNYRWASNENAIEAFDFVIGDCLYVDVKSTSGVFEQKIHISINELLHMRDLPEYRIYRVYLMEDGYAKLRVSNPLKDFAVKILSKLEFVGDGVRVDSISVSPDIFDFESEISLELTS